MKSTLEKEKNMEILLERLIHMIGKQNERVARLQQRIQHLERTLQTSNKE